MNNFLRLSLIAALALYAVLVPTALINQANAKTKSAPKKVSKSKKIVTKKVLGITFKQAIFSYLPSGKLISCNMPDGKIIKATQKDCDSVNDFWNKHKPSAPSSNNNSAPSSNSGSNDSGSNSNSNDTPEAPVIPTPVITSVAILPCTSSSCSFLTTVTVSGTQFSQNATISLIKNGVTYTGQYVGGNGSTSIIVDFQNLTSGTYDVKLFSPTGNIQTVVKTAGVIVP